MSYENLSGSIFGQGSGDESEIRGDTKEPYEQFEKCRHIEDFACKFIQNDGTCIFETCVMDDHEPPRVLLWYFKCLICKQEDCIKPEEMRAPFCHSCIQRMNDAEELPHNCKICGRSVYKPAQLMMSGICDECFNDLCQMIMYHKDHPDWKHVHR
jgi:hypothetical protein